MHAVAGQVGLRHGITPEFRRGVGQEHRIRIGRGRRRWSASCQVLGHANEEQASSAHVSRLILIAAIWTVFNVFCQKPTCFRIINASEGPQPASQRWDLIRSDRQAGHPTDHSHGSSWSAYRARRNCGRRISKTRMKNHYGFVAATRKPDRTSHNPAKARCRQWRGNPGHCRRIEQFSSKACRRQAGQPQARTLPARRA